jgi:hypothetical protein
VDGPELGRRALVNCPVTLRVKPVDKVSTMTDTHLRSATTGGRTPVNSIRLIRIVSAAVVAAIAAWSSYWHMVHVALHYGERREVAYVLPLSVDGVLTIAAIVMAEDRRTHRPVRLIAKVAFLAGLCASIAANIAGAQPTLGGRLIAAWPALALLLIVEMLLHPSPDPTPPIAQEEHRGEDPEDLHPPDRHDAAVEPVATEHRPELHHMFHPEPPHTFHPVPPPPSGTVPRRRPITVTRQLVADLLAAEPDLTREQIATRLGVSTRRLRAVLASAPNSAGRPISPSK